jgi:hypothetical protein
MFLLRDLVSARTWLAMTQHLVGLFIGFAAIFIFTFGLGFGAGFVFLGLVGIPILGLARAEPGRVPVGRRPAAAGVHRAGDLGRDRLRAAAAAVQRGRPDAQRRGLGGGPGRGRPAGLRP